MTVYLVGAGPGDPGLLTRRGARLLADADVVLYDRLVHHSLLALAPVTAELIDVGKHPGGDLSGTDLQEEINRLLIHHGRQRQTVVRLKGGDPFLFGRGSEEVEVLSRAAVPWVVVPGVSSAFGVPAAAGIPVTHRGLSSSVTVVTGRGGDAATEGGVDWESLAKLDGTLVILMGMTTRAEIARALQGAGKSPDTPTAVVERGTTTAQRVVRTTLEKLAEVDLGSPSVIVVGPVAALGADQVSTDPPGPLSGKTVVVTRSGPRAHGLVDALHGLGASVLEIPLTTQTDPADGGEALRREAARAHDYAWVILTSANAANRLMGELRDARALGQAKVAAVGPSTADALRMTGVEPDLIPAEHWAQGLIEEFADYRPASGNPRILFPCADQAPSTIPDGLAEKGWEVTRVEAYRTVDLPTPEPELVARVAEADALTFTATSSIRAFLRLTDADGAPLRVPPLVICIGPTTAQHARELGLANVHEAHGASTEGLVAALLEHSSGSRASGS
jgi:uroporphyrinogen III methyltransferase / synthase